jgi:hypothetical protein
MALRGWSSCEFNGSYRVGLGFESLSKRVGEFSRYTRFDVGDDSKIKFWHDVWCGEHSTWGMPLRLDFGMMCGVWSKPLGLIWFAE